MSTAEDKRKTASLEATTIDLRDFTLGSALYLVREESRLVYDFRAPLTQAEAHRQAKAQARRWGAPENPKPGFRNCVCNPGPIDISVRFGGGDVPELVSYLGINANELSTDPLPLARAHAFCPTCDGLGLVGDAENLYPVPCQFCDGTGLKARGDDHLDAYHDRAIAEYTRTERHGGIKVGDYTNDAHVYGRRHDDFNADLRPGIVVAVLAMLTFSIFRWGDNLVRWVQSWGWLS